MKDRVGVVNAIEDVQPLGMAPHNLGSVLLGT